jgi:trehalose 6-phosphate phosphatase
MTPPVPERPALFLDFDGTLVEIAPRPDAIEVAPHLPHLLERLIEETGGALAVISGRTIQDIESFLKVPVAAAGMHGLQRRMKPGAPVEAAPPPDELDVLRRRIKESGLLSGGIELEDKGAGLAVHYRAAPEREGSVKAFLHEVARDLEPLQLIEGKMVVEAKAAGFDKGEAVNLFMENAPFAGRTPVFVGDDTTDEDGMRAAAALGGFGVKVGDGPTLARYRLADVPAVHDWLGSLLGIPA